MVLGLAVDVPQELKGLFCSKSSLDFIDDACFPRFLSCHEFDFKRISTTVHGVDATGVTSLICSFLVHIRSEFFSLIRLQLNDADMTMDEFDIVQSCSFCL